MSSYGAYGGGSYASDGGGSDGLLSQMSQLIGVGIVAILAYYALRFLQSPASQMFGNLINGTAHSADWLASSDWGLPFAVIIGAITYAFVKSEKFRNAVVRTLKWPFMTEEQREASRRNAMRDRERAKTEKSKQRYEEKRDANRTLDEIDDLKNQRDEFDRRRAALDEERARHVELVEDLEARVADDQPLQRATNRNIDAIYKQYRALQKKHVEGAIDRFIESSFDDWEKVPTEERAAARSARFKNMIVASPEQEPTLNVLSELSDRDFELLIQQRKESGSVVVKNIMKRYERIVDAPDTLMGKMLKILKTDTIDPSVKAAVLDAYPGVAKAVETNSIAQINEIQSGTRKMPRLVRSQTRSIPDAPPPESAPRERGRAISGGRKNVSFSDAPSGRMTKAGTSIAKRGANTFGELLSHMAR